MREVRISIEPDKGESLRAKESRTKFIGMELIKEWYDVANLRINEVENNLFK